MATVTNNLTRIHDAEGTLTSGNIPSGGGGAGANTDIFLQGSQSLGRRQTNTSDTGGFALVDGADNDCSASGTHVGVWTWVTQYGILDDLRISLSTGTTPSSNYKYWQPALSEIPKLGGWLRIWIENNVGGTTGAGTYTASQTRCYGVQVSFSTAPGGTSPNLILDAADYLSGGGAALTLTGTSGLWSDFSTSDENTTNQYGVFRVVGGVYNCLGRVKLGTSGSSLVFNDSNFTIIFPQQGLVSDTWMGIDVDLQNASTNIDWAGGVIKSASTKKGDLVVTGTSGTFDASGMTLSSLRIVTLTSVCAITSSSFIGCGQITAPGSTLLNSSISGYEGTINTSALIWDANVAPNTRMDGMTFTKGTAATHAIEFGTTSPTDITLTDVNFVGYNASNGQNDSAIHIKRTTGTVTITIDGGTTPSYRSDGAAVVIVSGAVTVAVNVKNAAGANIQDARVYLKATAGGPFPADVTVTIANSSTTATVTHTGHGMATNDKVVISGASHEQNNGIFSITVSDVNTYTYTMGSAPGSNPTGTIKSTFVALHGLTDSNGNISTSRVYASAQPVVGWVKKASAAPYYKQAALGGSVSNTLGYNANAQLISDE